MFSNPFSKLEWIVEMLFLKNYFLDEVILGLQIVHEIFLTMGKNQEKGIVRKKYLGTFSIGQF